MALIAAIVSRHFRRVVVVAAVVDGVADWLRRRDAAEDDAEPIGLLTFLLLKRVDDLAYGIGLWYGVLRERNLSAPAADPDVAAGLSAVAGHSDVLVVGAGSAGSVVAERLSTDPSRTVRVLEAGPGLSDAALLARTRNGLQLPIGSGSPLAERYLTTLTDHPVHRMPIVRGTTLGGSGAVNGGYFCRGLPGDFDGLGLPGWAWSDVLEHFRAIETDLDFDTAVHGGSGPIAVRRTSEFTGTSDAFVAAAERAGLTGCRTSMMLGRSYLRVSARCR